METKFVVVVFLIQETSIHLSLNRSIAVKSVLGSFWFISSQSIVLSPSKVFWAARCLFFKEYVEPRVIYSLQRSLNGQCFISFKKYFGRLVVYFIQIVFLTAFGLIPPRLFGTVLDLFP